MNNPRMCYVIVAISRKKRETGNRLYVRTLDGDTGPTWTEDVTRVRDYWEITDAIEDILHDISAADSRAYKFKVEQVLVI